MSHHSDNGPAPAEEEDHSHPLRAATVIRPSSPTFAELGVRPEIVRALAEIDIERTFAIQELTLPLALKGEDVIGQARTGTGKTLGFGVPLLHRLETPGDGVPQALVVVPTRELCLQVRHDLADAGKYLGVRLLAVYGGRPYEPQIAALRKGVDVVVGTPGRLLDLAEQGHLVLGKVRTLVLDEADEMLDLGFLPDVERILQMVPEERHTMLFSATMPGPVITMARTFLNRPTHIRAEEPDTGAVHERTRQFVYQAHSLDKVELISRVLQAEGRGLCMIFVRTKRTAQKVADELSERGFAVGAVHGDLGQGAREQALRAFRTGKIDVLVATDVAARGIDVDGVTHVINYQCPEDEKTYVHRIGRTGRAGRAGVAITLVDWDEVPRWKLINKELGLDFAQPVETYSTSPHLYTDLNIPPDATGRLPLAKRIRAGLAAEPEEEGVAPKRRRRRRTRRGVPTDQQAAPTAEISGNDTAGAGDAEARESGAADAATGAESHPSRRRRRRRRRGGETGGGQQVENQHRPENDQHRDTESQRPRRRRRRRRSGGGTTGAEASAVVSAAGGGD